MREESTFGGDLMELTALLSQKEQDFADIVGICAVTAPQNNA